MIEVVHQGTGETELTSKKAPDEVDDLHQLAGNLGHLARLSLAGRRQDIELYLRRLSRKYREMIPALSEHLSTLLKASGSAGAPIRSDAVAVTPVDEDTRLHLVRHEYVAPFDVEPIWPEAVRQGLEQLVLERQQKDELEKADLFPTRSALFTGPPGVGKSLAARWIALALDLPLVVLDLSAVMSSFLGKTGTNLRHVLDYAKSADCVLLLDELDAVAKRRDDIQEVGELKRLVTVLLQEIDDWPPHGLLLAATNHADLLDPAVWRRFELIVQFPLPNEDEVRSTIRAYLGHEGRDEQLEDVLTRVFEGRSFNDIERQVVRARREAVVHGEPIADRLHDVIRREMSSLRRSDRIEVAASLVKAGLSQWEAHRLTGVSRDTIRNRTASAND